jgi:hypothetical protein
MVEREHDGKGSELQAEVAEHYERMALSMMVPVEDIPVERVACMVRDRMCGMGHELCYSAASRSSAIGY